MTKRHIQPRNTQQRRHGIMQLLLERGEVSVDQLVQLFNTSEVTIRKDLTVLENNGFLVRRYGGAILMPQIRIDFLREIAWQKAQALARFHGRAGEHDALHGVALQRIHRAGYGQKGFARASGANAKGDVVAGDVFQIHALVGRARFQPRAAGVEHGRAVCVLRQRHFFAGQHELHGVGPQGLARHFIQRLQHGQRAFGAFFGAVNLELLVAVGNADLQPGLDGAQVLVCRTAQIGQACVVGRDEGVAQDHGSEMEQRK